MLVNVTHKYNVVSLSPCTIGTLIGMQPVNDSGHNVFFLNELCTVKSV